MRFTLLIAALASVSAAAPNPSSPRSIEARVWKPVGNWDSGPIAEKLHEILDFIKNVPKKTKSITSPTSSSFKDWKSFKANGVNLGGWLSLEKGIDPSFFNDNGASAAIDEESFCEVLGKWKCGLLLEKRYATFITTSDIDFYASYGVNTLRIPIGYWAFMGAVNGNHYHTGSQLIHLAKIANYAILKKGMHVVLDLHGLPGGQNGLDNQGKTGDLNWWHNSTNMDYTLDLVKRATDYILRQPRPEQWTLSLINEPLPEGPALFGQTDDSVAYLNDFYNAAIKIIRRKDPSQRIPIMLSDGFSGEQRWEPWWGNSKLNIVFDTHIYFFVGGSYPFGAPYEACYLAKSYKDATNPVFIGEWSIQASSFNTGNVSTRALFYQTQFDAYNTYLSGGAFWNGKHFGTNVVGDDGTDQSYYWSWEKLANQGVIKKPGEQVTAATCDA